MGNPKSIFRWLRKRFGIWKMTPSMWKNDAKIIGIYVSMSFSDKYN